MLNPISIYVNTFNTGKINDVEIINIIKKNFNLTLFGIVDNLNLRKPIYNQISSFGHFGRNDIKLSWEKLIKLNI